MSYTTYQQQPEGSNGPMFTFADILNTFKEFPGNTAYYFATNHQDILCIDAVSDQRVQWCAPKAEQYIELPFVPDPYYNVPPPPHMYPPCCTVVVPPPPDNPPPGTTVTPEPSFVGVLLLVLLIIVIARVIRSRE